MFEKFKSKIYQFVNWFLNLSLYWKVGFIIGSCFFINLFLAFYFYYLFNHTVKLYKEIPYYYEILTDKALAYSQGRELFFKFKKEIDTIITELESVKEKYPQIQPQIGKLKKLISESFSSPSNLKIKDINQQFLILNKFFVTKRVDIENRLLKYKRLSKYFQFILLLTMLVFLAWGTWAFYYMVKKPLDKILERLDFLAEEEEHKELNFSQVCLMEYTSRDEIGKIITKLNQILNEYNSLRIFKHTIENDETPDLVYERLGYYLKNTLDINYFIIYQVSNSQNTMTPVYISVPELEPTSEIMFDADKCRAKRTGEIVSSVVFPNICKIFPLKDDYEYYCIPMNSGGKCIGVVAIYIPKEELIKNSEGIKESIKKAKLFINESAPVIEAKRYAEALKEQTFRDALTGLYNRHFLEATLENLVAQILRRESVLGILMCDLDFFKSVNDRYGHDVGDLVLKETARILSSNVRKSDMVVRFGGEEFLVLLIDVKEGESVKVGEKLRFLIESHEFKIPQGSIRRTISIGVSEFPVDTQAIWEAIKFADVALYKAKELGRNKVVRFKKEFWTEENY